MFNFIRNIGTTEIIIILLILLVIFGARILTGLGKTSGETFREIKKIKKEMTSAVQDDESAKK